MAELFNLIELEREVDLRGLRVKIWYDNAESTGRTSSGASSFIYHWEVWGEGLMASGKIDEWQYPHRPGAEADAYRRTVEELLDAVRRRPLSIPPQEDLGPPEGNPALAATVEGGVPGADPRLIYCPGRGVPKASKADESREP